MFFLGALWPWAIQSEHGWGGDCDVRGCFGSLPFLRDLLCWLDPSSLWGPSKAPSAARVDVLFQAGSGFYGGQGTLTHSLSPLGRWCYVSHRYIAVLTASGDDLRLGEIELQLSEMQLLCRETQHLGGKVWTRAPWVEYHCNR